MGQNEPSILGKAAGAVCVALRVQEWGEEKGDYPERTVQRGNQTKKRGGAEIGEEQSNGSATLGQGPGSSSRSMHNNIFEFFCRTGAPTQVEDGNFRLNWRLGRGR